MNPKQYQCNIDLLILTGIINFPSFEFRRSSSESFQTIWYVIESRIPTVHLYFSTDRGFYTYKNVQLGGFISTSRSNWEYIYTDVIVHGAIKVRLL
jgi:hypothetical protein